MLGLTLAVLLASMRISESDDFEKGVAAYKRGDYTVALRELKPIAEQGDAEAQYQLGKVLMKGLSECDAAGDEKCIVRSALDAVMWFKIVEQHSYPRLAASGATTMLRNLGRASGLLGNRLGLFQLVTDKLAENCIEKFYFECGFYVNKNLFPPRTEININKIIGKVKSKNLQKLKEKKW